MSDNEFTTQVVNQLPATARAETKSKYDAALDEALALEPGNYLCLSFGNLLNKQVAARIGTIRNRIKSRELPLSVRRIGAQIFVGPEVEDTN